MNLPDLIKTGESNTVEFKEKFDEQIIESAVAFANTKGGIIFIGVSDKNNIKGIKVGKETLNQWTNQISQSTDPRIIPELEQIKVDGKTVIAVKIKENPIKPISKKGRCLKRVDSSNRAMSAQEVAQMHLHSTGMSWDKYPAKDASLEDIDIDNVNRYIRKARETGRKKIGDDEEPMQVLEKMNLITEGQTTWAAILLFSQQTNKFISQAAIHCGRFKEKNIVIDDRMIVGTVFEQIDEAMDFIRKNINVEFVMTGRPQRDQIWDYPLEALREALINAICHRDYTIFSNIEVRIYDDKLIIRSPGFLPYGITLEELYKPHSSTLRNKGLAEVLYDTELIERWGSGIEKIQQHCLDAGLPEPIFEEYQGFQVVFRKDVYDEEYLRSLNLNERQIKAVMYVKEKEQITNKEYQEVCATSNRTASRDLADLVSSGLFDQVGITGKGTVYIISYCKDAKDATKAP
ncbi:MAG: helix-turn-helix domain-containing protein [Methanosarcinales archaeon]|nr:helix-turn-helix domain-containing protein [Methanosarcinales archaeon]